MLHYSCDACKRPINAQMEVRHVVKIEIFPAIDDATVDDCCAVDCSAADDDHLEEMQELLQRLDAEDEVSFVDDGARSLRFDLCESCRQRFVKNPLGVKSGKQLNFSNN